MPTRNDYYSNYYCHPVAAVVHNTGNTSGNYSLGPEWAELSQTTINISQPECPVTFRFTEDDLFRAFSLEGISITSIPSKPSVDPNPDYDTPTEALTDFLNEFKVNK